MSDIHDQLQKLAASLSENSNAFENFQNSIFAMETGDFSALDSHGYYYYYDDEDCEFPPYEPPESDCEDEDFDFDCTASGNATGSLVSRQVEDDYFSYVGFENEHIVSLFDEPLPEFFFQHPIRIGFDTVRARAYPMCQSGNWATTAEAIFKFSNITIPPNAVIDKATLTFLTADEQAGDQVENTPLTITGLCLSNISNVIDVDDVVWKLPRTNTKIDYNPEIFSNDGTTEYETTNFACVIDEIIKTYDWESGDDLAIIIQRNWLDGATIDRHRRVQGGETQLNIYWHIEHDETGNGGLVGGGTSEVSVISNRTSEGGVVANGEGYLAPIIELEMSGGVLVGGQADLPDPEDIIELEMAGGVLVNGQAWIGGTIIPQGGVVVGQGTYQNGYKYRSPFVIPPGAVKHDLDRFYPIIVAHVDHQLVETGTDFRVEDNNGNTVLHSLRSYHEGKLVFSIKTPLTTSGNSFWLYFGRS